MSAGRPRIGPTVKARLPLSMIEELDHYAEVEEVTRADVIRDLLANALDTRRHDPDADWTWSDLAPPS